MPRILADLKVCSIIMLLLCVAYDTLIHGNQATNGAGVYCSQTSPTMMLTRCNITSNAANVLTTADAEGGGINVQQSGKLDAFDCMSISILILHVGIIADNTAKTNGGGIHIEYSSKLINLYIHDSIIRQSNTMYCHHEYSYWKWWKRWWYSRDVCSYIRCN